MHKPPIKFPRRHSSKYMLEVQSEHYGKMFVFSGCNNDNEIVRLKFDQRKWEGGFYWDSDRNQMHVYSVRIQKHKRFRFGWEYNMYRLENEPLGNLKKVN